MRQLSDHEIWDETRRLIILNCSHSNLNEIQSSDYSLNAHIETTRCGCARSRDLVGIREKISIMKIMKIMKSKIRLEILTYSRLCSQIVMNSRCERINRWIASSWIDCSAREVESSSEWGEKLKSLKITISHASNRVLHRCSSLLKKNDLLLVSI